MASYCYISSWSWQLSWLTKTLQYDVLGLTNMSYITDIKRLYIYIIGITKNIF